MSDHSKPEVCWWRRGKSWRTAGVVVVLMVAAVSHWRWWRMESPALHGLPAVCLGLVVLLLLDSLVAFARGTARRPREALRWLISRAAWRGAAWRLTFLVTSVVFFYSAEFWRGRMAWARLDRDAALLGERLDQSAAGFQPVPDEQNFALAPLFAPLRAQLSDRSDYVEDAMVENLGDLRRAKAWNLLSFGQGKAGQKPVLAPWALGQETDFPRWLRYWPGETNGVGRKAASPPQEWEPAEAAHEVLRRLETFEPDLAQLREYAVRPFCRFQLDYPRQMWRENHAQAILTGYLRIVRMRASALLAAGRAEDALHDVELALRLIDLSRQQPWAIVGLMRQWAFLDAIQPVWEGLRSHRWTAVQVEGLQGRLEKLDLLADYPAHVRNDAVGMADLLESFLPAAPGSRGVPVARRKSEELQGFMAVMRGLYPAGWSLQDQVAIHRFHLEVTAGQVDVMARRAVRAGGIGGGRELLLRGTSDLLFPIFVVPKIRQMAIDASMGFPAVQTMIDQAVLACALERFRLADGRYPEQLGALVPRYLRTVLNDIMTGEPMVYRPAAQGYVLYSVGGNGVDDGGAPVARSMWGHPELGSGDWVWKVE